MYRSIIALEPATYRKCEDIAEGGTDAKYLKKSHIQTYIEGLIEWRRAEEVDPYIIERNPQGFAMPKHIIEADAPITHLFADFLERLEIVGCGSFRDRYLEKDVKICFNRL